MKKGIPMHLTVKLAFVFLFFSLLLYGFDSQQQQLPAGSEAADPEVSTKAVKTGTLSPKIRESSGLEEAGSRGVYFTHNDAGNAAELYKINAKGKLLATLPVAGAENIDWEDITRDKQGNIYIADTGDNDNSRKHLKIYKLLKGDPENVSEIIFEYGVPQEDSTGKSQAAFDCEAVFWHQSRLFLVTKDRDTGKEARIYALPDTPGHHKAKLVSHYPVQAPVTAADISPDGKQLMLLSEGKIHMFQVKGTNFFGSKMVTRSLGDVGQTEGAVFTGNRSLMITSEKGDIYRLEL